MREVGCFVRGGVFCEGGRVFCEGDVVFFEGVQVFCERGGFEML